jgi:hypothetical protein
MRKQNSATNQQSTLALEFRRSGSSLLLVYDPTTGFITALVVESPQRRKKAKRNGLEFIVDGSALSLPDGLTRYLSRIHFDAGRQRGALRNQLKFRLDQPTPARTALVFHLIAHTCRCREAKMIEDDDDDATHLNSLFCPSSSSPAACLVYL